jgi:hypothetical protein
MADKIKNVAVRDVECDEVWSFIGKKEKRVRPEEDQDPGTETIVNARHPSKRREECQRWDSGRHDLVEHRLHVWCIGRRDGVDSR